MPYVPLFTVLEDHKPAKPAKPSPFGSWKVTAEGPCGTYQLGIYHGHVAVIALHLAKHPGYILKFMRVGDGEEQHYAFRRGAGVHVSMGAMVGKKQEDRTRWLSDFLNLDPSTGIEVRDSMYYGSAFVVHKG